MELMQIFIDYKKSSN